MSDVIEVWSWEPDDSPEGWSYRKVWGGDNIVRAVLEAFREKKRGVGCVKVEWR